MIIVQVQLLMFITDVSLISLTDISNIIITVHGHYCPVNVLSDAPISDLDL